MHVPYKDGGTKHNFHGTGKKLYSQNEKLIGQITGHSIKMLLFGFGFFLFYNLKDRISCANCSTAKRNIYDAVILGSYNMNEVL